MPYGTLCFAVISICFSKLQGVASQVLFEKSHRKCNAKFTRLFAAVFTCPADSCLPNSDIRSFEPVRMKRHCQD